jgi:hypothetical protein
MKGKNQRQGSENTKKLCFGVQQGDKGRTRGAFSALSEPSDLDAFRAAAGVPITPAPESAAGALEETLSSHP